MNEDNKNTELDNTDKKLHISDVMFSSFYECGKCKLVSKEHKEHMIKNGMKGDMVRHIQSALLRSGQLTTAFQLAKDNEACKQDYKQCHGTFGKKTIAAVKEFQDANDLVIDGFVGPDTAEALYDV